MLLSNIIDLIRWKIRGKTVTIQMKATEQHFSAVLLVTLYKTIDSSFQSLDEIVKVTIPVNKVCHAIIYCSGILRNETWDLFSFMH